MEIKEQRQIEKDMKTFKTTVEAKISQFLKEKEKSPVNTELQKMNEFLRRSLSAKRKSKENIPDSSKYRGVCWDKKKKKWKASIKFKGIKIHIGLFLSEEDAAKAYDNKAKDLLGDNAILNFPI